ncbi:glycosyltransferase family 4 protein [Niveispirillum sp.]|uniref:glycosyltransferase family 4 protein n=1 Tax=Niveispirillum sp. TaxID=1917217 RepID=UPI001B4D0D35|nr:glycosyltransferase family 4 protein [Niveispirillum sp.]MBP7337509.1 glycosyltransferase family 4 protein [Niveispirillum sp.]
MPDRTLHIICPGDINQLTGGYGYLRRLVAGLRDLGEAVTVHELPGPHPFVDDPSRDAADAMMAAIPDGARVLIDGLALPVAAHAIWVDRYRLRFAALVHHPLHLENGLTPEQADILFRIERDTLAHMHHVIVPSRTTMRGVIDLSVPAGRITIANPGTDPAEPAAGSGGADGPVILCVATLTPRKGHLVLIDALARVKHLPWRLHLVGSDVRHPGQAASITAAVAGHDLADRVRMLGELSGPALETQWRAADLFTLVSFHEGYGMVAADALKRGLPCIVTDAGGLAEVVPPAAGAVVPPGDVSALSAAFDRLLSDPAALDAARRAARGAGELLPTWQHSVSLIRDALSGMLVSGESDRIRA